MSENKQKRKSDETYLEIPVPVESSIVCDPLGGTPIYDQAQFVQVLNGVVGENNAQSNLVYIIVPADENGATQGELQTVLTPFIIPGKEDDVLHLHAVETSETGPGDLSSSTPPPAVEKPDVVNVVNCETIYNEVVQVPEAPKTTTTRLLRCDFPGCSLTFPSLYHKNKHSESHTFIASKEFKCSICNMVFEEAAERNKHIETHTVVNTYKCDGCQSVFPYYTSYIRHIEDYKCSVKKPFLCHICQNRFVEGKILLKHLQSHSQNICKCRYVGRHTSLCKVLTKKIKEQIRTMKRRLEDEDDDED